MDGGIGSFVTVLCSFRACGIRLSSYTSYPLLTPTKVMYRFHFMSKSNSLPITAHLPHQENPTHVSRNLHLQRSSNGTAWLSETALLLMVRKITVKRTWQYLMQRVSIELSSCSWLKALTHIYSCRLQSMQIKWKLCETCIPPAFVNIVVMVMASFWWWYRMKKTFIESLGDGILLWKDFRAVISLLLCNSCEILSSLHNIFPHRSLETFYPFLIRSFMLS